MKTKKRKSKRNLFMSTTLMCIFLIGTFKFDENSVNWIWSGQVQIPIILGILSIVLGRFWIIEEKKIKRRKSEVRSLKSEVRGRKSEV